MGVPSRSEWIAVAAFGAGVAGMALVANGFAVIRHEGRSPTTCTPLVVGAGLVVLAAGLTVVAANPRVPTWTTQLIAVCCVLGGYLVVHLIAFAGYALLYTNLPDRAEADAIVILGCGPNRRSVTPLLGARLDRGIRAYRVAEAAGALPVIVTCGGQGDDEATSEADAMARYLAARGLPMNVVVRERHSHNTAENLENCIRELALRGIPANKVRITVVTSNFHVLRAAALTRRLGIDAQVVGARTAGYFIPAAFLREFFAVLATHYRRAHLAAVTITVAALTAVIANAALPPR
ncbi:YdcF family protein [Nocardia sp. NPDC020380]|uniref:YdcF family protein n=1 Tax=Nocardia sp. NPDC020380 TaxID=3364309 RepID=UPI0037B379C4